MPHQLTAFCEALCPYPHPHGSQSSLRQSCNHCISMVDGAGYWRSWRQNPAAILSLCELITMRITPLSNQCSQIHSAGSHIIWKALATWINGGYVLLRAWENRASLMTQSTSIALERYFESVGQPLWGNNLCYCCVRWAQLQIPTGQIARSTWKENQKNIMNIRMSRNVKVSAPLLIAILLLETEHEWVNMWNWEDSSNLLRFTITFKCTSKIRPKLWPWSPSTLIQMLRSFVNCLGHFVCLKNNSQVKKHSW